MVVFSSGPAARAMRRVRLRSKRKFWPSDFFARRSCAAITSRSGGRGSLSALWASAIWAAMRIAAIMLRASALPVPAMSNAVPWSGEVRMIGRPSVTFTPSQNDSVLIGISAWS